MAGGNYPARFIPIDVQEHQKGRQKGRQKGATQVLVRQLEKKFGELSSESLQRLNDANEEQILEWSENILSARTLGDVFGH